MKDHKITNVSWDDVVKLIEMASGMQLDMECFEGVLVDEYVIYDTKRISMNDAKPREYIIVQSTYRNEWSPGLDIIMTDNLEQVERFVASRRAAEEEQEMQVEQRLPCFYFTFGQGQTLSGHCQPIYATDEISARSKMNELYGNQWAFCYPEERWLHYKENPLRAWTMETELEAITVRN